MRLLAAACLLPMAVLAGCGAQEPLPPKSAKVPAGVDLSGQWELRAGSRDTNRRIAEAERQVAGANESLVPRTSSSRKAAQPDNEDVRVHVFLEAGESLRITQTDYGLFISFDRAIVEEYRFGEQRTVSVGPIEADLERPQPSPRRSSKTGKRHRLSASRTAYPAGKTTLTSSSRVTRRARCLPSLTA